MKLLYVISGVTGMTGNELVRQLLHQSQDNVEIIGFDTCCYTNNDIGRREVRINMGYFFHREPRRD